MAYSGIINSFLSTAEVDLSWKPWLGYELQKPYMERLESFLEAELAKKKIIYPQKADIFKALSLTPYDKLKVVILGQDPYHGPNQAHGLCFSVQPGTPFPPSLQNIFKELERDLKIPTPKTGSLEHWAKQGVLLLNSVLTVEKGLAASHQNKGWELFSNNLIRLLNEKKQNLVFVLWGKYAEQKGAFIDPKRHLVLKAAHPSPFSAHRGFLGCGHFSKINAYLESVGKVPIEW